MASTDVNVRVAVRCRPMNARETQLGAQSIVRVVDGVSVLIRDDSGGSGVESPRGGPTSSAATAGAGPDGSHGASSSSALPQGWKQFTFDHAYFTDATQAQIYGDLGRPIVDQALLGYNGTIFAYGQTGSGKTHTMMGSGGSTSSTGSDDGDWGIIPRMNADLFARIAAASAPEGGAAGTTTQFLVTVSFLEIYNEVIKDLLNPSDKLLKIREHPDLGIYVEQLAELVVREPADVRRLLEQGNKVRQVAATHMNERSSRSHSCFTLKIASKTITTTTTERETRVHAKINLVDLAGSERAAKTGATGDRLKEGAAINKSLSALGNVITLLADKKRTQHVPYRDSKLTRLLQESLGGNSLTVMVAAISPADDNYDESLGTLQYASRAKAIKNATRRNEDVNERLIRELREEIERLRQMVRPSSAAVMTPTGTAVTDPSPPPPQQHEMMQKMEETIANLERAKQASWEEQQRLTERFEQERLKSLHSDSAILGFMQTVKQEKMDMMRRIKGLQQQRVQLTRELRARKESYNATKTQLQREVERFQTASSQGAWSPAEKQVGMAQIEQCKALVLRDRDELARLKDALKACEERLVEEEAEVATKSALLEEDDHLRRAIQEDEREKMRQERETFLEAALADERRELERAAEEDRRRLEEALAATADKEQKLAEEVEIQRQRALALQDQLRTQALEHRAWRAETRERLASMVQGLKRQFSADERALRERHDHAVELLRVARDDILALSRRNAELEATLRVHEQQRQRPRPFTIRW